MTPPPEATLSVTQTHLAYLLGDICSREGPIQLGDI